MHTEFLLDLNLEVHRLDPQCPRVEEEGSQQRDELTGLRKERTKS